jgi:hypothetical protein
MRVGMIRISEFMRLVMPSENVLWEGLEISEGTERRRKCRSSRFFSGTFGEDVDEVSHLSEDFWVYLAIPGIVRSDQDNMYSLLPY